MGPLGKGPENSLRGGNKEQVFLQCWKRSPLTEYECREAFLSFSDFALRTELRALIIPRDCVCQITGLGFPEGKPPFAIGLKDF